MAFITKNTSAQIAEIKLLVAAFWALAIFLTDFKKSGDSQFVAYFFVLLELELE